MKKHILILSALCLLFLTNIANAEVIKGHIVGYYTCGTMVCNFVTPDAGTFDFEVANKKVSNIIFKKCKLGNVCRIQGSFDTEDMVIVKVTKVEDSKKEHVE